MGITGMVYGVSNGVHYNLFPSSWCKGGTTMVVKCPRCQERMIWHSDFSCDEVYDCPCEEGIVSYHSCHKCNTKIELLTDCKGDEEE